MADHAGSVCAYWMRVHQRAVKATRQALLLQSAERIVIASLIGLFYLAFVWSFVDDKAAFWAEVLFKGFGSAAVILTFPLVYLWKFRSAPAEIDSEQQATILSIGTNY